jgi:hypothetical protein
VGRLRKHPAARSGSSTSPRPRTPIHRSLRPESHSQSYDVYAPTTYSGIQLTQVVCRQPELLAPTVHPNLSATRRIRDSKPSLLPGSSQQILIAISKARSPSILRGSPGDALPSRFGVYPMAAKLPTTLSGSSAGLFHETYLHHPCNY